VGYLDVMMMMTTTMKLQGHEYLKKTQAMTHTIVREVGCKRVFDG
jgi:hypothetical protein